MSASGAAVEGGPHGPAYRIETPRLVVRCWQPADAPLLAAAIAESDAHLRPWIPWMVDEPMPLEQRIDVLRRFRGEFDLGKNFIYGIFDRDESQVLGGTGLHVRVGPRAREIGYWIRAGAVAQGLAKEAVAALVRVAFEIDGVERLEIHCAPDNGRSASVARRLGFFHEATLRRRSVAPDGTLRDSMIWTLLPDEYRASAMAGMAIRALDAAGRGLL